MQAAARRSEREASVGRRRRARSACSASSSSCATARQKTPMAPFNGTSDEMAALGEVLPRGGALHVRALEHVLHEPAAVHHRGAAARGVRDHRSRAGDHRPRGCLVAAAPFESLDYIYTPAPDFEAAVRFYTETLGGELRWRIHDGGVWVAAVRVSQHGAGGPACQPSRVAPDDPDLSRRQHRRRSPAARRRWLVRRRGTIRSIPQGPRLVRCRRMTRGGQRVSRSIRARAAAGTTSISRDGCD